MLTLKSLLTKSVATPIKEKQVSSKTITSQGIYWAEANFS